MSTASTRPARVLIYEPYPFGKVAGNLRTLIQILRYSDPALTAYTLVAPFDGGFGAHAARLGYELHILTPPGNVNRYGGQAIKTWHATLKTAIDIARYNRSVARFISANDIDVVYANSVRTLITIWLGARLARRPVVLYVKGQLEHGWIDRIALLLANRVLFFSRANRDEKYPGVIRRIRNKVEIVEIGLDPEQLEIASVEARARARTELGFGRGLTMIAVGQLYAPKGFHHLVAAFAKVKDEFPQLRLVIVGDPIIAEHAGYESTLRATIESSGLRDRIILTGWRDDVLALVAESDFLVHPSLAEGFGRAVLEGMALGKPVIATRIGGLQDTIVQGENGLLVTPGDEPGLADAIRRVAGDGELRARMGAAAAETVRRNHLAKDKVLKLQQVFRRVAQGAT